MKYENEITVESNVKEDKLIDVLLSLGFEIKEEYTIEDSYMINNDYVIGNDYLDTLKHTVLLRRIIDTNKVMNLITYKYKEYDQNGDILKQGKIDLDVGSIEKAEELFKALNYSKLIDIRDRITVFSNGKDEMCVQAVNGKHVYIEMEQKCNYLDKVYESVEVMKEQLKKYDLPVDYSDFFVKKAEIELKEIVSEKENRL